jgi:hypothetical protein
LHQSPDGLEKYRPAFRYLVIDEGAYDDGELALHSNLVALLFRLENCVRYDQIEQLVNGLVEHLKGPAQESLRRAFAVWLDKVIVARLTGERVLAVNDLWERHAMLSERFDVWEQELRQEGWQKGRQEGELMLLIRLLQKRFGELPDPVRARLCSAGPHQLEHWGERLLEASTLSDLFSTDTVAIPGPKS